MNKQDFLKLLIATYITKRQELCQHLAIAHLDLCDTVIEMIEHCVVQERHLNVLLNMVNNNE